MLGISSAATVLYFIAFAYIVASGTSSFTRSAISSTPLFAFLENLLDLLSSISRNPFQFFFAVVMNFILLYGVFLLNVCSLYLVDIAKALEQRRTGGRDTNEVELHASAGLGAAR
jgi:hypothetical protein